MTTPLTIRAATETDLPAIVALYNHYVGGSAATFDIAPVTLDARRVWFGQFSDTSVHQLVVATRDAAIVGYAHSTQFRPKPAYAASVEVTVYVDPAHTGQGIGAALYGELFDRLATAQVHRAYGVITLPNEASIGLHERFGFVKIGVLSEAGIKFGKYWDTLWMERRF